MTDFTLIQEHVQEPR